MELEFIMNVLRYPYKVSLSKMCRYGKFWLTGWGLNENISYAGLFDLQTDEWMDPDENIMLRWSSLLS